MAAIPESNERYRRVRTDQRVIGSNRLEVSRGSAVRRIWGRKWDGDVGSTGDTPAEWRERGAPQTAEASRVTTEPIEQGATGAELSVSSIPLERPGSSFGSRTQPCWLGQPNR